MVLQILLIISICLQLVAAVIAIKLISKTKYNLSWILFTIALVTMTVSRCAEYLQLVWDKELEVPQYFFVWMGVVTSLCFAVGVLLVKKIFNWIDKLSIQRRLSERRILNAIISTEEKERLRFSKELHDGLGPLLSSAKMSLSALQKNQMSDEDLRVMQNTQYVIEQAIVSLREISNNLSPRILNDFGLSKGVRNFINRLPSTSGIEIKYETNLRLQRFNPDIEVILYRVVCELINNSLKHSDGTEIFLSILYEQPQRTITIEYADNGKGFDPDSMFDSGMGLSNIYSRISSLKGSYHIESSEGKGMEVEIVVSTTAEDKEKNQKKMMI